MQDVVKIQDLLQVSLGGIGEFKTEEWHCLTIFEEYSHFCVEVDCKKVRSKSERLVSQFQIITATEVKKCKHLNIWQ